MIARTMESASATASLYLQSPYVLEVIAVLVFLVGMIFPLRDGLKIAWRPLSAWRRMFVILGWVFLAMAAIVWIALIYLTVSAWMVAVENYYPKPFSFLYVIFGGFLYFFLVMCSGASFSTASGSARDDILRKLGTSVRIGFRE